MLKNLALRFGWVPLVLVVCLPVTAQQLTPDQTRCRNKGKAFSLDVQISGCTAVLQSDVSAGNRAVAYTNRGIAYSGKKDYDRGIADFNEAIGSTRASPSPTTTGAAHTKTKEITTALSPTTARPSRLIRAAPS